MTYLQDALVTAVALWAGWVVFRRVAGFVKPKSAGPGCANCPTASGASAPAPAEQPLVFIKSSRH